MSRKGRSDRCMSIHHSITSRELLIVDSGPTDVGTEHIWKFIVLRAPTNTLRTCSRYGTRIVSKFPLEPAASTKANILKHRLAQLHDYATHAGAALVLKITKKDPTGSSGCFVFSFSSSHTQQRYPSVHNRITWCHPNDAGRYVSLPHRTSQNTFDILRARNIDVLCRHHSHVTDAQRGPRSLLPHFTCRHSFQPESQSTFTFSHASHFDALPSHTHHKEPTKTNEKPQHRKHGHPLHDQGRWRCCSGSWKCQ